MKEDGSFKVKDDKLEKYTGNKKNIVIPDDVTELADSSFSGCDELESVTISDDVKIIGDRAFENCSSLTRVAVGASVKEIDEYAFDGCVELKQFSVTEDNDKLATIGGVLFSIDKKRLIKFPLAKDIKTYTVPDGVKRIEDGAFCGALYLQNIIVPDSVTYIGDSAFLLESDDAVVSLPKTLEKIGENVFSQNCDVYFRGSEDEFEKIKADEDIICRSITFKEEDEEEDEETEEIEITKEDMMEEVAISINDEDEEEEDTEEETSDEIEEDEDITIQDFEVVKGALEFCNLKDEVIYLPEISSIKAGAFHLNVKEVVAKDGLKKLGDEAFSGCEELESVTLPKTLEEIGDDVFYNCLMLKEIIFEGDKKDWKNVEKGENWKKNTGKFKVVCSDGKISKMFA